MILITGALGYIGSHLAAELASSTDEDLLLVDMSCHESEHVLENLRALTKKNHPFEQVDILCRKELAELFKSYPDIRTVVHCAAKKNVFESIQCPLDYYANNLIGSYNLLIAMKKSKARRLVFSSTAAVYADAGDRLYDETMATTFHTAYGNSKLMFEVMLQDYCKSAPKFSAISLRYFNVAGAHPSGKIGELLPNYNGNLFQEILKAALGKTPHLTIYGNDYPSPDGTGIRDYIHVMDVARGHVNAIHYFDDHRGFEVFNLGCGRGYSVLEALQTFEKETRIKVPHEFKPRRAGDLCAVVANPEKAKRMGWTAHYDLTSMIKDAWRFAKDNN